MKLELTPIGLPETKQCLHCPLELPAELLEERKHQSRPNRRR
jgi:hypothetical protein